MLRIVLILSLIVSVLSSAMAQDMDDAALDSLAAVYYTLDDGDTAKLNVCQQIAKGHYNPDSTIAWSKRMIGLAKIHQNARVEAQAYGYLSWAYYFKDEFLEANKCNYSAIIIADSIGDDMIKADNYKMLGDNYCFINDYQQAHIYYADALDYYERVEDTIMIAACSRSLAQVFTRQKMYGQAEDYYRRALVVDSLSGDVDYLFSDHVGLAEMLLVQYLRNGSVKDLKLIEKAKFEIQMGELTKSDYLYTIFNALEIKSHILVQEALGYGYDGERLQELLDSLRQVYETGYAIIDKLQSSDKKYFDVCRANYLTLSKNYDGAKAILDSLLVSVEKSDFVDAIFMERLYTACDLYYTTVGDYKNAYYYKSKFYEHINNQYSINYAVKAAQEIAQSRFDEQMNEHAEKEAQRKRRVKYGSIVVSLLLLFALYEIFRTRRHNRILNNKNELLEIQKSEINSQNAQIMDSIGYASLIQRALMPNDAQMKNVFNDFYVIYRPLNIVAGDFYWMASVGKYKIVVGADSTGHGVPGAFVSVLGINLLNDLASLVMSNGGSPAKILNEMRRRLMLALGQDREKFEHGEKINMDGIDLALAIVDTESNTLKYAGAYRPLWVFDGNDIQVLKPDKMPIGVYVGEQHDFSEQTLQVKPGDCLYMFSDGITDQFGYLDDTKTTYKHYSVKRLLKIVGEIADKPFAEQHQILESTIDAWQNGYQQLDDILFLAVKI
ncbi:MAG: SpoIIE family protein phosphatase [Bacteroidales bacterium]|nr:SpoIIE family protein phosphatase [Bacteroidales bacterium]